MSVDHGRVASRGDVPSRHLQRPQMDESAAAGRETLGERGRTLMARASKLALVTRAPQVQIRLLVELLLLHGPVSAQVLVGAQALALAGAVGGGMLRVSTEPQTSARRRCCGCELRQNRTGERGRRASNLSPGSKCSLRDRTPVRSCRPGRLRKRARYRTLVDGAHAACVVSYYKRGEGDLGGTGAPLV